MGKTWKDTKFDFKKKDVKKVKHSNVKKEKYKEAEFEE